MNINNFKQTFLKKNSSLFDVAINDTIKKTYVLLSFCILLAFAFACIGMQIDYRVNIFVFFIIFYGLLHFMDKNKENYFGLLLLSIFTSFLGFYIGPYLKYIMFKDINGGKIICTSLVMTSATFLSLFFYVIFSRKNFDFLQGSLGIAFCLIISLFIINLFFYSDVTHLILSGLFALFSSLKILYTTSQMVYEKNERNYILISVSLFLDIYNLFLSFLHILSFSSESK